jgi:hypothetical protein
VRSAGKEARLLRLGWLVPATAPLGVLAWALASHRVIAPEDGLRYYLPVHRLGAEAFRAGHVPAWNPFQFSGSPLLATAQPAPFYPLEGLFMALPKFLANDVYVVCNLSIASLGTFFLARRLTQDPLAAVVAGLAFVSCGFMYGQLAHQSVEAAIAWLPWLLVGFERLRDRVSALRVLGFAAPLAASLLAGQPQMVLVSLLVLVVYGAAGLMLAERESARFLGLAAAVFAVVAAVQVLTPDRGAVAVVSLGIYTVLLVTCGAIALRLLVRRRTRLAWALALAVAGAAAGAAVQILPLAMIVGETSRASYSYDDAVSFSFPGSHLPLLLFPLLFGGWSRAHPYRGSWNLTELSAYPGAAAMVLAVAGLARSRRDPRFLALAIAAGLLLVVALGRATSLSVAVWALPLLGHFRSWGRYAVVLDLAVAVGAAYGVAALRSTETRAAAVRLAVAASVLVAVAAVVLPLVPGVARYAVEGGSQVSMLAPPVVAALAAVACALLFARHATTAALLCGALVVADGLVTYGIRSELADSPTTAEARVVYSQSLPPAWGPVASSPRGITRYLYLGSDIEPAEPYLPQATDLKRLRSASGYDPLAPSAYLSAVGVRQDGTSADGTRLLARPGWVLDVLRITTVVLPRNDRPRRVSPLFEPLRRAGPVVSYRYAPRLPAAFLVGAARDASHPQAVAGLHGAEPAFDPRDEALIEECSECGRLDRPGRAGIVGSEHRADDAITLAVDADRRAALVVSEAWFPGWSASVDGRGVPVRRADGVALGVLIGPGRHRVRLHYAAPGFAAGAAVTGATALALAGAAVAVLVRRRRASSRPR